MPETLVGGSGAHAACAHSRPTHASGVPGGVSMPPAEVAVAEELVAGAEAEGREPGGEPDPEPDPDHRGARAHQKRPASETP